MIEEKNLEELLEKNKVKYSLEESAEIMKKILYALHDLHQKGKLHLELCPENILLFPEHVILLPKREEWRKETMFWVYSAPEVRMKNLSEIGPAADVYSACAIFFRLLMQRRMTEKEVIGRGMYRYFPSSAEVFLKVSREQMQKTAHILFKGLHTLPRKRYSCAGEVLKEVEELCERPQVSAPL